MVIRNRPLSLLPILEETVRELYLSFDVRDKETDDE